MDTQRWNALKLAAAGGGRLVGEARDLLRSNGRLAARSAVGHARASLTGNAPVATWPRRPLSATYDVIIVGDGLGSFVAADVIVRRAPGTRVAVLAAGLVGEDVPCRPRAVLRLVRERPVETEIVARSAKLYEHYVADRGMGVRLKAQPALTLARDLGELRSLDVLAARAGGGELVGEEAAALVGHLDAASLAGGLLERDVLVADIDDLLWELGGRASAAGTDVIEQCRLEGLEPGVAGGWTVVTSRGRARADVVIDATPESRAVSAVGGDSAATWRRWEAVVTQHVQPFLRAHLLVAGAEISQTARGEVVVSGHATPYPARQAGGSIEAAAWLSGQAVSVMPRLGSLRVIAQTWRADLVEPDGLASVGATGFDGLLRLGGMGSDPMALEPALGEAVAHLALGQAPRVPLVGLEPHRAPVGAVQDVRAAAAAVPERSLLSSLAR